MTQLPENIRPWGRYDILGGDHQYQAKRIEVQPGGRLSYQRHQRRSEYWIIIAGRATFTLDDVVSEHGPGEVLQIPKGAKHRVACAGDEPLIFIEVQTGDYFGEDDIERFSDDYGREGTTRAH